MSWRSPSKRRLCAWNAWISSVAGVFWIFAGSKIWSTMLSYPLPSQPAWPPSSNTACWCHPPCLPVVPPVAPSCTASVAPSPTLLTPHSLTCSVFFLAHRPLQNRWIVAAAVCCNCSRACFYSRTLAVCLRFRCESWNSISCLICYSFWMRFSNFACSRFLSESISLCRSYS